MTEQQTQIQQQTQQTEIQPAPQGSKAVVVIDESPFANLLDSARFNQMWRVANLFSTTAMIPAHFQNKPADCFIGIQMAVRLGVDPFMFLQNCYIVHGRPGLEAKLAIALINSSGIFTDSLDYEIEGENPTDPKYRVRAKAVRKSTGKEVCGPWVDWPMVRSERWDQKDGSKWKTMPGIMFQYRAAMFFGRLHCPERLMGMQTADELDDISAIPVVSNVVPSGPPDGRHQFAFKGAQEPTQPGNGNGNQATADPQTQQAAQSQQTQQTPAPAEQAPDNPPSSAPETADAGAPTDPPKIPWADICKKLSGCKPDGMDDGAARLHFATYLRGGDAKKKNQAGAALWDALNAQQQFGISDLLDSGQFTWPAK